MKINVIWIPFGEVIEVRQMSPIELGFAKYRLALQKTHKVIIKTIEGLL